VTPKALKQNQNLLSEPYAHRHLETIAARWDAKAKDWEQSLKDPTCHLNEDGAYVRFIEQLEAILRADEVAAESIRHACVLPRSGRCLAVGFLEQISQCGRKV
jgi:hypothetical protein